MAWVRLLFVLHVTVQRIRMSLPSPPELPGGGWQGGRHRHNEQPQPETILPPDGDTAVRRHPVRRMAGQPEMVHVGIQMQCVF